MLKFLIGFGSILILLGTGGIINHISMVMKAAQEEQEMYGGSIQFITLQLIGSMGPYLTSLIGGGIIIAIAAFLIEYQKRTELTSKLVNALSDQFPRQNAVNDQESSKSTDTQSSIEPTLSKEHTDDERYYWNG